ncbi:hypothetical protein TVAG_017480 [Trichomonas vaginalis G3]|uniref:Uncharacterized protein n=1 Tax=Trichomonas vaginalis (strain ATCC PRA-98 / G3) TaxID=412133 RepID=A2FAU7_TRIV3|nr:protein ubiquitination [Trichomonas vaginalis G3]EAX97976.1 hypothetical protein TVAG_017480 [Trichomonas vaginalis G3]KAI5502576.1 protein ubiquitination [Trichomonas vaginalis G3]|eukprot:XP_001310906.1 hypothetical protein [Trichomonas vaginalis G3]
MSQSINLDINCSANNIQAYFDQGNFFDMFDAETISDMLEKTKLNCTNFITLLTQGKSKYNSSELYSYIRKCNVDVESFDDAINILKSYAKLLKLKSSHSLIAFFEKYKNEQSNEINQTKLKINEKENEISKLRNNINQLNSEISTLKNKNVQLDSEISTVKNKNNQLLQSINDYEKISELQKSNDFNAIYNFLKEISNKGDKVKMSISCAAGLSEKRDSDQNTPLLWACYYGNLQLTKSLIEGGCDRNAVNKFENNCLVEALLNGHLEIVKYLIGIGFDKNWRTKTSGFNAILYASQEGQLEVVKYLQSIGCDVNSKQNNNANCIYFASSNGHLETVKYLVSAGANPNEKDKNGFSSLIAAASNGHLEVVKYLIQYGCNKNDKTNYNNSSLHWAAMKGHYNVAEYLVSIGVNLSDKDNGGKTALDYAKEKQNENENYKKIMNLLIRS